MYTELVEKCVDLTDHAIDERLRQTELEIRQLQTEQAILVALCQSRGSFRADGHRSINAYLRATFNGSPADATRIRRLATVCDIAPQLGEALFEGRVGATQILEIARIHVNPRTRPFFPIVAPTFLTLAEHAPYRELAAEITSFINQADQDGAFDDVADDVEHRTASVHEVGGTLDVRVTGGDPLVAAEVVATFEWFCEQELQSDVEARRLRYGDDADNHPLGRTAGQRRYDAFIAMVRAARQHGDGTTPADVVINVVSDPETLIEALANAGIVPTTDARPSTDTADVTTERDRNEHAETGSGDGCADDDNGAHRRDDDDNGAHRRDDDDNGDNSGRADAGGADDSVELADHHIGPIIARAASDPDRWLERRCHTSTGIPLHPALLVKAALFAHIRRVILDSEGVIVDAGRKRRLFTGAARELAKLLTATCTHPGCLVTCIYAQVDHIEEWHEEGGTDQANADLDCGPHNRFKSRQRWRTRRDDTGRPFRIRPDGSVVLPVGAREPVFSVRDECERARQRLRQLVADRQSQ